MRFLSFIQGCHPSLHRGHLGVHSVIDPRGLRVLRVIALGASVVDPGGFAGALCRCSKGLGGRILSLIYGCWRVQPVIAERGLSGGLCH